MLISDKNNSSTTKTLMLHHSKSAGCFYLHKIVCNLLICICKQLSIRKRAVKWFKTRKHKELHVVELGLTFSLPFLKLYLFLLYVFCCSYYYRCGCTTSAKSQLCPGFTVMRKKTAFPYRLKDQFSGIYNGYFLRFFLAFLLLFSLFRMALNHPE